MIQLSVLRPPLQLYMQYTSSGSETRVVLQRLYTPQTNLGTTIASQYFEKSTPIDN